MSDTESSQRAREIMHAEFRGPLPPAAEFQRYEEVQQGAADRILVMAETEQMTRHEMERIRTQAAIADSVSARNQIKRGQFFGLIVSLSAIVMGSLVALFAQTTAGTIVGGIIGSGGLASVIIAFTWPRTVRDQQAEES